MAEIYFLRDAITHNHIWTFRQTWDQGKAHYSHFDLDLTWQDPSGKVARFVKGNRPLPSFPRTKNLNMIVVPTFVGCKEVAIAFKTVKDALELLDKLGHLRNVPKVPYVRYGGELSFPFWRLIGRIQRSFLAQKT